MLVEIKNKQQFDDLISSGKTILADFYADWCGPCKILSPIIKEVANEISDDVVVCKINSDSNLDLAREYMIQSIPMLIVFKNKNIYKTSLGVISKKEILEMLADD
ncbi:MAG: thioredoxin [Clostridiales bacterium]|jgi:thioredoxin|nr:thioredoxin [Clostridiales bacterium]